MARTFPNEAPHARTHTITVCVSCRRTGGEAGGDKAGGDGGGSGERAGNEVRPGRELIERLGAALASAHDAAFPDATFTVSAVACMAGCKRPCTVAFQAERKATYLFGDIAMGGDDDADVEALAAFARQYAALDDGWCSSKQRPAGLSGRTLARVPALPFVPLAGEVPFVPPAGEE